MAGELAAEWIKIPDGNGNLQKVWVRDSTARRDIATLQTDVSGKADAATTLAGYGITDAYTKTQVDGMIPSVPSAYTSNPEMDGTASPGSSAAWARGDHVHPTDTSRMPAAKFAFVSGTFPSSTGYATTVSYPTGFDKSNSFIVSWNVTYRGTWRTGYGAYTDATGRYFWNLNNDGIQGYNSASAGYGESWKLLLMRTDI